MFSLKARRTEKHSRWRAAPHAVSATSRPAPQRMKSAGIISRPISPGARTAATTTTLRRNQGPDRAPFSSQPEDLGFADFERSLSGRRTFARYRLRRGIFRQHARRPRMERTRKSTSRKLCRFRARPARARCDAGQLPGAALRKRGLTLYACGPQSNTFTARSFSRKDSAAISRRGQALPLDLPRGGGLYAIAWGAMAGTTISGSTCTSFSTAQMKTAARDEGLQDRDMLHLRQRFRRARHRIAESRRPGRQAFRTGGHDGDRGPRDMNVGPQSKRLTDTAALNYPLRSG